MRAAAEGGGNCCCCCCFLRAGYLERLRGRACRRVGPHSLNRRRGVGVDGEGGRRMTHWRGGRGYAQFCGVRGGRGGGKEE